MKETYLIRRNILQLHLNFLGGNSIWNTSINLVHGKNNFLRKFIQ